MHCLTSYIERSCPGVAPVVVALSGGVDSSLVAAAAHAALGARAVAVTVQSELVSDREFTRAVEMAEHLGLEHHPLCLRLLEDATVRRNGQDRCYACKRSIFQMMISEYGDACCIVDGTNGDDDPARPGLRAVKEFGVVSPLKACGMGKPEIRDLARALGLPSWDRASESCLATRIQEGMPLDVGRLNKVRDMETFFHKQGVDTLRACHDNLVATVTYLPKYAEIFEKNRDSFAALIERIGLRSYVFKEWQE